MSHTPGPWFCFKNEDGKILINDSEIDAFPIAEIYGVQDEQNARLIAASPDLLAALKAAVDLMEQEDFATLTLVPKFRAVIAKAEGK